jgi:superfamily II DNA/RNA helicase
MDIDKLIWVMNFDLPFEAVYYIHRCGRVGRKQEEGFAYNLVTPKDINIISRINEAIQNQSAIRLTSFDEKKFSGVRAIKAKAVGTKLDKKKKQLETLKQKVYDAKKTGEKKHVKVVKGSATPRYKREDVRVKKKAIRNTDGRTDKNAKPYSKGNAKPNARTNPKSNTNTKKRSVEDTYKRVVGKSRK